MKNNKMTQAALALTMAGSTPMALPAVSMQTVMTASAVATTLVLAATPEEAKAACTPAGCDEPPAPPPPPPVVITPTVITPPVTTPPGGAGGNGGNGGAGGAGGSAVSGSSASAASQSSATGGTATATGGDASSTATGGAGGNASVNGVSTGDQNVTVQGSTTTYRQVRQAPGAYAPTVIAPTAVGRCHESSGGPSGGVSTPLGGISFGGKAKATINGACEAHVQSLENRADGRLAADSIEAVDAESACLARVDAMDANPIISDATVSAARTRCETEQAPTARRSRMTTSTPDEEAPQDNTPVWPNPASCPNGYSLRDVSSRVFEGKIEMPNSTGGTTTYRVNGPVMACQRG